VRTISAQRVTGCLNRLFALRGAGVDVRRRAAIAKSRWQREDSPTVLTADNAVIASGQLVPEESSIMRSGILICAAVASSVLAPALRPAQRSLLGKGPSRRPQAKEQP